MGAIAELGSGGTPKRSVSEYFGEGTPWLSIADLNDGVVHGARESLTAAGIANSSARIVPPGTLFVAMYGSIGKLAIAGSELCTSQAIAFINPDETVLDRKYLFHYLLARRPYLQSLGRGGTQMNIGQSDLRKWPIPLPPLPEQRRIAAILDHADALRSKRRQVISLLDDVKQSIFHDMFGDPIRDADSSRVGDTCDIQIGPFGSLLHQTDYVSSGIPLINPTHIIRGEIKADPEFSVTPEKAADLTNYRLRPGDIVMGRRGEMGRCAVVGVEHDGFLCGTGSLIVRPITGRSNPTYVHASLSHRSSKSRLERLALGSTLPNLNAAIMKQFPLGAPSLPRQEEFASRIRQLDLQRGSAEVTLEKDGTLFASLQSRAFRGEL